jgi:hypothetical protein
MGETSEAVTLSITLANQWGRPTSSGNGLMRSFQTYDAGRVTAAQYVQDGASRVFTNTYGFPCSSAACTATTTATNGSVPVSSAFPADGAGAVETVSYTYDLGGGEQTLKTTLSGTTQNIVNKVVRNARGQTAQIDYGDGTSTTHLYNDTTDLRPRQLETTLTATPTTILQLFTYAFDAAGNVSAINDYCNEAAVGACSSSSPSTTYSS